VINNLNFEAWNVIHRFHFWLSGKILNFSSLRFKYKTVIFRLEVEVNSLKFKEQSVFQRAPFGLVAKS
jgi:hypothetical protein